MKTACTLRSPRQWTADIRMGGDREGEPPEQTIFSVLIPPLRGSGDTRGNLPGRDKTDFDYESSQNASAGHPLRSLPRGDTRWKAVSALLTQDIAHLFANVRQNTLSHVDYRLEKLRCRVATCKGDSSLLEMSRSGRYRCRQACAQSALQQAQAPEFHIHTRVAEHLLKVDLQGVHEERVRDIHHSVHTGRS